ncbi:16886_t:CDS:1, partial [Dentiscutata heterogama]
IDIGNKSSWVWKYCGVKTDGRAYCRYIINENEETECGWNCVYNSQTSSMIHHLGSVYKKYEE